MGADLVPVSRLVVDDREAIERLLRAKVASGRLLTPIDEIRATPTARNPEKYWFRATFLEPAPKLTFRQRVAAFDRRHPFGGPVFKALAFGVAVAFGFLLILLAFIKMVRGIVSGLPLGPIGFGVVFLALAFLYVTRRPRRHLGQGHKGKGWHYTDCK